MEAPVRSLWDVIEANFKEGRYSEGGEAPHQLPPNLQGPYFILVAYALENLFKAVSIQQEKEKLRGEILSTRRLPKGGNQ